MVASEAVRMSRAQVYGLESSCRKAASGCASVSRSACERRRMVIVMQTLDKSVPISASMEHGGRGAVDLG